MEASKVTESGVYWMKVDGIWEIARLTFIEMEGYGVVLHALRPGETWHVIVSNSVELVGPLQEPV